MMMSFDEEYREEHDECRNEIESLTAKVKHYESIESEMLMIGVERAKDEYESKLIALQLDNRRLREALEEYAKPTASLYACNEGANKALSRPTDTSEADALMARVKELEGRLEKALSILDADCQFEAEMNLRVLNKQLTAARAVIEEAEKALNSTHQAVCREQLFGITEDALARIREWKERGK